ncbi:MarR family winged helix-turn-helix transcriptional regulator [Cohnella suwonensis]|uniref:MarR family winged helix-turn-helix transcriptional regulator n=1 Tax=Cohnella suwonensis TaxID=696072 RepID=A0ABW0LPW4_9BACL
MDTDSAMKLNNQLCFAAYAFSREITKLYHPLLKELGLTYTQYVTMLALWEEDGITVKRLGQRLYLDSGTLTPLLKKLEQMGLLSRIRDKSDERSVIIALTEKGIALKEEARLIPEKMLCQAGFSPVAAEELRAQLASLMNRIQPQHDD